MATSTAGSDDSAAAPTAGGAPQAWPSASQDYYTVFVMGLVVMFAEVDRGVMSLLVQAIKKDYQLKDWMMGLLLGPLFALFYALCGLPLARFIDRSNRRNILAIALALWSVATAMCGLA
jgi:predicted MFS family arabinose efflux permease